MVHPGPDFSVHDVHVGWYEAFQKLGVEVQSYNLNDRLIFYSTALKDTHTQDEHGLPIVQQYLSQEQAFAMAMQGLSDVLLKYWPDVVIFVSAFFTTESTFALLRARNFKTVLIHTESPYQDDAQLQRAEMADLNLLNDAANLDKYLALGVPAYYQPHSYRPSVHHPRTSGIDRDLASDLCFIGTMFPSRYEFFSQLDLSNVDVLLGGSEWGKLKKDDPLARHVGTGVETEQDCIDNTQAADLYRNSQMGVNFYRREAEPEHENDVALAMGPREVEMAACGLPFLRDPREEGDKILSMLPTFSGPADASEKLRWWLDHPEQRYKAAGLARAAIEDRTFENAARNLLQRLEKT
jgi:spore maturation protein CgeB